MTTGLLLSTPRPVAFLSSSPLLSLPPQSSCRRFLITPTCTARSSSRKPRRKSSSRRPRSRPDIGQSRPTAIDDPLLNDNDIDTTDITTFVSCPVCFNSLMIRPQQLDKAPLLVNCNCCGKTSEARIEDLENLDGTFDYKRWRIEYNSSRMTDEDIAKLDQFSDYTTNSSSKSSI